MKQAGKGRFGVYLKWQDGIEQEYWCETKKERDAVYRGVKKHPKVKQETVWKIER